MSLIYTKLLTLPGIIVALSFHEFAHAWMSNKFGDPTPKRTGRLTINPFAHIDIVGFICMLICGFGWGKPVQINPCYYKHRRRDEMLVALAGVTLNLIIAIIFSFPTKLIYAQQIATGSEILEIFFYMFYYTVQINLCLMIFNLIPVPPLDGWNVLSQLVNLEKYDWYWKVYQYGGYILLALVIFRLTDYILMPCINFFMNILF